MLVSVSVNGGTSIPTVGLVAGGFAAFFGTMGFDEEGNAGEVGATAGMESAGAGGAGGKGGDDGAGAVPC